MTVEVTSLDRVMSTVCCWAVMVCDLVTVFKLVIVAASGAVVSAIDFVTKLVESTVMVEGLRVVVFPTVEVDVTVV